MALRLTRRTFLVSAALTALPVPAFAQAKPVRMGLLTVKTGPLATGGIQMEQGTIRFLKDRNYTLAGRKVELVVGDTGGNPAGTKTKTQELVERDNVDMILGPLAAFELLAISDYAAQAKMPILSLAAAEDMTQRKPNPYFVRSSGTSAQYLHPLADYAAKELKFKRVITIADDFAFGHEQMGGFQRVFEDAGGRVVKKLWPPLVTPDYSSVPGTYSAGLYIAGMVAEAALEKTGGKTDDREAFNRALRAVSLTDTPRGPFHFDHFGNVVGTFYLRRCERKGDKLVNTTIKTYPSVSQFWTYDEKWFLSQPVYSRDYPPLKS